MSTENFTHSIQLLTASGDAIPATLHCELRNESRDLPRKCTIRLQCDLCQVAGEGLDFFEAFSHVREQLWDQKLVPRCYGASLNAFP